MDNYNMQGMMATTHSSHMGARGVSPSRVCGGGTRTNGTAEFANQYLNTSGSANAAATQSTMIPDWNDTAQYVNESTNSSGMQPAAYYSVSNASSQMPETLTNSAFLPAYLSKHIGLWMRVEFLIGNDTSSRVGQLLEVGASYILLKMLEPDTTLLCDLFSIKFVTIIYDSDYRRLLTPA